MDRMSESTVLAEPTRGFGRGAAGSLTSDAGQPFGELAKEMPGFLRIIVVLHSVRHTVAFVNGGTCFMLLWGEFALYRSTSFHMATFVTHHLAAQETTVSPIRQQRLF
jgi:hypothetical protein